MTRCLLLFAFVAVAHCAGGSFDYTNADFDWPKINAECGGVRQSPINIVTETAMDAPTEFMRLYRPSIAYNAGTCGETTEGVPLSLSYGVKYDLATRGWMIASSALPNLQHVLQVHSHSPSEHTVNGISYPLEMHFVTADFQGKERGLSAATKLAVVGILYEEGTENDADPFVQSIIDSGIEDRANAQADCGASTTEAACTDDTCEWKDDACHNKAMMVNVPFLPVLELPNEFYEYEGSLTTPPCWENVAWHVSTQVRKISPAQRAWMEEKHDSKTGDGTARPVQPLNGRHLWKRSYVNSYLGKKWDNMATQEKLQRTCPTPAGGNAGGSPININFGNDAGQIAN